MQSNEAQDVTGPHRVDEVEVLFEEYRLVREDSRSFWTVVPALLGLTIAVVGAEVAFASSEKPILKEDLVWLWAVIPLGPLSILGLLVLQFALGTARSNYEKAIERRLLALVDLSIPPPKLMDDHFRRRYPEAKDNLRLPVPSHSHYMNQLTDIRRGPALARIFIVFLDGMGMLLFVASIAVALSQLPFRSVIWWSSVVGYAFLAVAAVAALYKALDGNELWHSLIKGVYRQTRQTAPIGERLERQRES